MSSMLRKGQHFAVVQVMLSTDMLSICLADHDTLDNVVSEGCILAS